MKLVNILSEAVETYFMSAIIKMERKSGTNATEIYNQVRAIKDIVVIKVISNDKLESLSDNNYDFALLEIKFINEGTPEETINMIKQSALKIPGLVKFFPRAKSLVKIRNY
jgi:uncharacterized protein with ParB-like and HNH nuclease domain